VQTILLVFLSSRSRNTVANITRFLKSIAMI